jgi:integrating conjugative element protein (TIGR03765 family)
MMRRAPARIRAFMVLALGFTCGAGASEAPVVVADHGGESALPYYRVLNLRSPTGSEADTPRSLPTPQIPKSRYSESDMLPVHSSRLTVGTENSRVIAIAGLSSFFLLGDDATSRAWLVARRDALRAMQAIGFVVEVSTADNLRTLRQLAPDLTLVPASADDLAERLGIRHYPVLITPTAIEP